MSIHVAIRHTTVYQFDRPITLSPHVVRLRPAVHARTPVVSYSLKIEPAEHFINWHQDPFGNWLARVTFPNKTKKLSVDIEVIADMTVINPFDFFIEEYAEKWPFSYPASLRKELTPYLEVAESGLLLDAYLSQIPHTETGTVDFLVSLNQKLQQAIQYTVRLDPGVQSCEETLQLSLGSCRDTGWLLVQILRHLGLAARFASGYLVQLTADEKALDGPSGTQNDFTDLHAWAEVYIPGAGWIGLDPTSGLFAGEGHIPLACTPHPSSAAPIEGFTDPCEVEFSYSNSVTRFREDQRVTRPYSDEQWDLIQALGQLVDQRLNEMDVRLTQGGEPTFVAIDNVDAPEWNTEALGRHKLERAEVLARRLQARFAPGGLLHAAQGKWYPGEPLPRWALGLYWRKDGVPIWHQPELLAEAGHDYGHTLDHAASFAAQLAEQLAVRPGCVMPAFEDALYYLLREAEIPLNIDPTKASLNDDIERRNLADTLSRGLDTPAGYVLPLDWDWSTGNWHSAPWRFRRNSLYLTPGESPIGLRLPLHSLSREEKPHEWVGEIDPFETQSPLPPFSPAQGEIAARYSQIAKEQSLHPEIHTQESADKITNTTIPHTAVCIEARGGCLHIFMPPLQRLEHTLSLIAAIERTAQQLNLPVVLEGYPPSGDGRLEKLLVTPDPGVIEVNIHPAQSWSELVERTTVLYEEARQSRLSAEKFMLDGRHSGTGGGNHVTFGGATPADSPFLRRPDLLQSLLTYWQHHPSLSYLFAGLFVGPTSQAPRVDEGRPENLYELEIAFRQVPHGGTDRLWLVDRLFRNLLTDLTGNTHRAEFCIDKLYSPDSPAGRQGLLEFRAFEMPPHARMSLTQMLLLRALIARFWAQPYDKPLVRWGTALHDRWMLPHYLWADLGEIVGELNKAGYPFQLEWFVPFLEFRFPRYGSLQLGDIDMELRAAIEPWPVLGEEATSQGTARYVDSSVERLQVKISGLTDERYALVCNGRRIPMRNTGTQGEYVAGVRYRAWQPPSALHPTIGVHSPLVFDLLDTWNNRSLGGCSYHVMHPGGRNYAHFPVNAYEAESRRHTRFNPQDHTPGSFTPPPQFASLFRFMPEERGKEGMLPPEETPSGEYPCTLDLRRDG